MPTWELNRENMEKFKRKLRNRLDFVKNRTAADAYKFLLDFGYHIRGGGPDGMNGPGWSYYCAANWNLNISTPIRSLLQPVRRDDEPQGSYADDLSAKQDSYEISMADHAADEDIFVTNPVWYAKKLNDGDAGGEPNRFMEQCLEHVRITVPVLIRQAKQEIR